MPSQFLRAELAIDECEQHLNATYSKATSIEYYLTQHILVLICAEMQQAVIGLVATHSQIHVSDLGMQEFLRASARQMCKQIRYSDIAGFVGHFGADKKARLDSLSSSGSGPIIQTYNNAVKDRHSVAHSTGASITFLELQKALLAAKQILVWTESAIQ